MSGPVGRARSMNVTPFASVDSEAKWASIMAPRTAAAANAANPTSHRQLVGGCASVAASRPFDDAPLVNSSAKARSLADSKRASGR
jgi:hypothetical protein